MKYTNFVKLDALIYALVLNHFLVTPLWSFEEVRGANVVLELNPSAANGGQGGIRSGFNPNLGNIGFDPTSLLLLNHSRVELSHSEEFGGANWDWFAWSTPIADSSSAIFLQAGRYSVDGVFHTQEGQIYEGTDIPTISVGDYFISGAWARQYFGLDLGFNLHGVYRKLDQSGLGLRIDAAVAQTWRQHFRSGFVLQGVTSSLARWESDQVEYSPPEGYLFQSFQHDISFFYGSLYLHWQSAGIFHTRANRFNSQGRSGVDQNPLAWLGGSQLGAQYQSYSGLILRAGLNNADDIDTWTAGAGLEFLDQFQVDFSVESHPELGRVNRVSLTWMIGRKPAPQSQSIDSQSKQKIEAVDQPSEEALVPQTSEPNLDSSPVQESPSQPQPEIESDEQNLDSQIEDDGGEEILEDEEEEVLLP